MWQTIYQNTTPYYRHGRFFSPRFRPRTQSLKFGGMTTVTETHVLWVFLPCSSRVRLQYTITLTLSVKTTDMFLSRPVHPVYRLNKIEGSRLAATMPCAFFCPCQSAVSDFSHALRGSVPSVPSSLRTNMKHLLKIKPKKSPEPPLQPISSGISADVAARPSVFRSGLDANPDCGCTLYRDYSKIVTILQ